MINSLRHYRILTLPVPHNVKSIPQYLRAFPSFAPTSLFITPSPTPDFLTSSPSTPFLTDPPLPVMRAQYRNRDGSIRPKRESCEFRGTALYASPFIHEGEVRSSSNTCMSQQSITSLHDASLYNIVRHSWYELASYETPAFCKDAFIARHGSIVQHSLLNAFIAAIGPR